MRLKHNILQTNITLEGKVLSGLFKGKLAYTFNGNTFI